MALTMSIKETAITFGLSEYAIRQGIRQGKFPAFQLNGNRGKYLIDRDTFANTLKNLCVSNICQHKHSEAYNNEFANITDVAHIGAKIRQVQE